MNLKEFYNIKRKVTSSWGIKFVWRNSNTKRYLRLVIDWGKERYEKDFFRKDKLLDRLSLDEKQRLAEDIMDKVDNIKGW